LNEKINPKDHVVYDKFRNIGYTTLITGKWQLTSEGKDAINRYEIVHKIGIKGFILHYAYYILYILGIKL